MDISKASFAYPGALTSFVRAVKKDLFIESRINYFDIVVADEVPKIESKNKHILDKIHKKSGVYAIWVKEHNQATVKYIGHTDGRISRQRMRNHFITKHKKTGAQLANIKLEILAGNQVGLTFVEIEPAEIRLYVEEMIIKESSDQCCWNKKSKTKINAKNL